ncbi:MAG: Gfo/Idh/MocA family oxidoreductase [Planctomycetes bacterium]|nr:Gfo/Idh/MocA family oxidoreductase [Planctomycetota bacterium]
MERKLRVAVYGVGHLGKFHARIWREHPRAELVAVLDVDAERARALAAELGCAALDPRAAPPAGLDLASVVVPTAQHEAVAVPLLERGVACLIEKPIAPDPAAGARILAAARRAGARVSVGHVERFQPGVRRVRELGLVPRFIECHRLTAFSFRSMDIGVVHDLMIHDLDLVLHLVGSPVASLDAAGGAILTEREDMASVRLVFENGARANVTASRVSLSPMRRLRLFSAESYVSLDFTKNYGMYVRKGPRWEEGRHLLATLDPTQLAAQKDLVQGGMLEIGELQLDAEPRPLQAELDNFLVAVAEQREPEVSGADGLAALELAERIRRALETQRF